MVLMVLQEVEVQVVLVEQVVLVVHLV